MNARVCNYYLNGYGHVNNACYLESLEEARWTFFEQHGLLSALKGIMLVVVRADIRYHRPAVEGDESHFEGRLKRMTSRHIMLTQAIILPNGKNAAKAEITVMAVNVINGCSISIPAPLSATLKTIATE